MKQTVVPGLRHQPGARLSSGAVSGAGTFHPSRARGLRLLLGSLVLLTVSACRVDTTVDVAVESNGSGTVTVDVRADAAATERIGDPTKAIRLADLREAGWQVADPRVSAKGDLHLRATRKFGSAAELGRVLGEIGRGADGPFIGVVTLRISDGFARTDYRFAADLKLSGSVDELSDPALTEVLGGLPVGRTPEELSALGLGPEGLGTLRVRVDLPGKVRDHTGKRVGDRVEWSAPLAAGKPVAQQLRVDSVVTQPQVLLFRYGGLALLIAAIALLVVGLLRRR